MRVVISATLRSFFGRKAEVESNEYPDAKNGLFDEEGKLRCFVRIYLNGVDVTDPEHRNDVVKSGDEMLLLPLVAGGAPSDSIISDERMKEVELNDKDIERFNKHLLLREISVKGQKRIKQPGLL